jgi:hypothetical protein
MEGADPMEGSIHRLKRAKRTFATPATLVDRPGFCGLHHVGVMRASPQRRPLLRRGVTPRGAPLVVRGVDLRRHAQSRFP